MLLWLAAVRVACPGVTALRAWPKSAGSRQRGLLRHGGSTRLLGLLIPVYGAASATVVYWPARLICVAQGCIRVTAVPWRVRRRDAAAAVPAEPVVRSGSQPAVSAGQLAWIVRVPTPALSWSANCWYGCPVMC